jgi:hypothetical protein
MCNSVLVASVGLGHSFKMRRFTRTLSTLAALAGLGACGGQTGEGDEGPNECADLPPEPLAGGQSTPLGFSMGELMEFASSARFELTRSEATAAPLEASLVVRAQPNSVQFIPTRPLRDVGTPGACRGRIELDVEVELTVPQPNGELQLLAAGRLTADSRYRAELTAQFGQPAFDALRTTDLAPEERLARLGLRALLTPAGSAGTLTAYIERRVRFDTPSDPRGGTPQAEDFVESGSAPVARWPADSACAAGELPLAPDESLFELTPQQAVQQFTVARTVRWSDGSTTKLKLEATEIPTACLSGPDSPRSQSIVWPAITPENPAEFAIPLELSVATEDGRFASRISTVLKYLPRKTGGLERAWISHLAKLVSGDAGGWSTDVADLGTVRSTHLLIAWPADLRIDSLLELLGPSGPSECSSTTSMCAGMPVPAAVPGPTSTLLSGTIE